MKDVQCYELFGGIALKNHAFSFLISCSVSRCNRQAEFTLLHFMIFHRFCVQLLRYLDYY